MPTCGIPCPHSRHMSFPVGISTSRSPCRMCVSLRTCGSRSTGSRYILHSAILNTLIQKPNSHHSLLFQCVSLREINLQLQIQTFTVDWDCVTAALWEWNSVVFLFLGLKPLSQSHFRRSMVWICMVLMIVYKVWQHEFMPFIFMTQIPFLFCHSSDTAFPLFERQCDLCCSSYSYAHVS